MSFEVRRGEIFGYLGPNGAGKTTTIKLAMGLLRPSGGTITCFGEPSTSIKARGRIGFLPEQPCFYQHLTASELLEFYGDLHGLDRKSARFRAEELLRATGLLEHRETRISRFSKGMLQRIGLAQALINDPDLVMLDEPLSGLDPVGRRELRDLITELKAGGKTVFFSSHILQDVEMICDRVAILSDGHVLEVADVEALLCGSVSNVEIAVEGLSSARLAALMPGRVDERGKRQVVVLTPPFEVSEAVALVSAAGGRVTAVTPVRQTLEDYFMNRVGGMTRPPDHHNVPLKQYQLQTAEGACSEDHRTSKEHV